MTSTATAPTQPQQHASLAAPFEHWRELATFMQDEDDPLPPAGTTAEDEPAAAREVEGPSTVDRSVRLSRAKEPFYLRRSEESRSELQQRRRQRQTRQRLSHRRDRALIAKLDRDRADRTGFYSAGKASGISK
jgi:hypothetical protein